MLILLSEGFCSTVCFLDSHADFRPQVVFGSRPSHFGVSDVSDSKLGVTHLQKTDFLKSSAGSPPCVGALYKKTKY